MTNPVSLGYLVTVWMMVRMSRAGNGDTSINCCRTMANIPYTIIIIITKKLMTKMK